MTKGQMAFVAVLLAAGTALLAWAAFRAAAPAAAPLDLARGAEADLEKRGFKPLSGDLRAILADKGYKPIATQVHPLLGQAAPGFSLEDVDGKPWTMKERKPGPLVLVFYYGYNCDHCVSQLFAMDKDLARFSELGAEVVAVSGDPSSLTRQRYAKYGRFGFPVLSDPGHEVAALYGAYKKGKDGEGVQSHATLIVGRDGKVAWANRGDEPFTEDRTLLAEIARLEKRK